MMRNTQQQTPCRRLLRLAFASTLALLAPNLLAQAPDTGSRQAQNPPPGIAASADTQPDTTATWTPVEHNDKLGEVHTFGKGDRVFILIPTNSQSNATYQGTFDRYADLATMYAITLRGNGGTQPFPGTMAEWQTRSWTTLSAAGIAEFMVEKDLNNVVIIGHGDGSQIAWLAAAQQPKRVAAIVSLNGFAVHPVPDGVEGGRQGMCEALASRMTNRSDENDDRVRKATVGAMVQNSDNAKMLIEDHTKTHRATHRRYMLEAQSSDITPIMMSLDKPALVIAAIPDNARGERSNALRLRFEQVYGQVPNTYIEYFDHTRHFIMYDNPDLLEVSLKEFISSLPPVTKPAATPATSK